MMPEAEDLVLGPRWGPDIWAGEDIGVADPFTDSLIPVKSPLL